jgi:hypothetical protein
MPSSQQAMVASDNSTRIMDGDVDEDGETKGRVAELEDDEIEDVSSPVHDHAKERKPMLLPFLKITMVAESSKGKGKSRRLVPTTKMHQSSVSWSHSWRIVYPQLTVSQVSSVAKLLMLVRFNLDLPLGMLLMLLSKVSQVQVFQGKFMSGLS